MYRNLASATSVLVVVGLVLGLVGAVGQPALAQRAGPDLQPKVDQVPIQPSVVVEHLQPLPGRNAEKVLYVGEARALDSGEAFDGLQQLLADPQAPTGLQMSEGFEGAWPAQGWFLYDLSTTDGGEYLFGKRSCHPRTESYGGWSVGGGAQGNALTCSSQYPNNAYTMAVYGPIDLSSATAASLTFHLWGNSEAPQGGSCGDYISWGSFTQSNLSDWQGTGACGNATGGAAGNGYYQFTLDLSSRLGQQGVYLAFAFISNASGAEIGYTIDDVTLSVASPVVPDPVDPNVTNDITALRADISNSVLSVQVTLRDSFQTNSSVYVWVDSDQDPATGEARYGYLGGADYLIDCFTLPPTISCKVATLPTLPTDAESWTDFAQISGASASVAGNVMTFALPVLALGAPTAVDLFIATSFRGAIFDVSADGDRCPDAGAIDTATGGIVIRRPIAHPIDVTFTDPVGDSTGGRNVDITSARFRSFGDQLEITLEFANPIGYSSLAYHLDGAVLLDSDHTLFTGFQGMGDVIQTWGGDVRLTFSITKWQRDLRLRYFQGEMTTWTVFQPPRNDGRYRISGNQLVLTASSSLFDARIQTSELVQGQWQDAWIRQPVSGDMWCQLATTASSLRADVLPEDGGALDTISGQAVAPLAWQPDLTITATDPEDEYGIITGMDLARIDAEVVDDNLILKTTLVRWDITDHTMRFAAYLDTDMNENTGWRLENNLTPPPYPAVGAEYSVGVLPALAIGNVVYFTTLYRADPSIRFHNLDAWTYPRPGPGNNYFTITIPLSAIGNPQELRLFMKSYTDGMNVVDVAPVYPLIIAYRNDHVSRAGLGFQPDGVINGNTNFPYQQVRPVLETNALDLRTRTYANDITAATLFWTNNPGASSQSDWNATPMTRELPGPGGGYDSWFASTGSLDSGVTYYKFQITDGADSWWIVRAGQDANVADATTTWTVSSTMLSYGTPLAVSFASFAAEAESDHILITWETASELGNAGFNLYRGTSPNGSDRQLNAALIPSQAPGGSGGFSYTWEDRADLVPGMTYYYWVEDVDLSGASTLHGPVSVDFTVPTAVELAALHASPATRAAPAATAGLAAFTALALAARGLASRRRRASL
jgi:hypothetical protein